jgi:GTP-binding protein
MLQWALSAQMPVHVLLTKSDKLKKGPAKATLLKLRSQLAQYKKTVSIQLFSALKHTGHGELIAVLNTWLTDSGSFADGKAWESSDLAGKKRPDCQ